MIEFDHVSKSYPGRTHAVSDVSFTIASHSTTVLVGPCGSGKSTVLGMVNRMIAPSAGRVLIDGVDVATLNPPVKLRRSIGYVMQEGGLLPHRTVLDNICVVPQLNGASQSEARRRARELMELMCLGEELARR